MSDFIHKKYEKLAEIAHEYEASYSDAKPFPSIYFEDFFNPEMLDKVISEFPDLSKENSVRFNDKNQKKFAGKGDKSFGDETKKFIYYLNSEPFLKFIQSLTGIDEILLGDPYFSGGGLHEIKKGGLLKIHADFNKHPTTGLDRRVNVLVYLNKDWKEEYGGHFELWDKDMEGCKQRVLPEFNTLAIFTTTGSSYHGHPDPLNCPEGMSRKSIALYYYSNGRAHSEINSASKRHNTLFQARNGNKNDQVKLFEVMRLSTAKQVVRGVTPPILMKIAKVVMKKLR